MAKIVVLSQQGIEPSVGRYFYQILGDPSVLGLAAAVGSIAQQDDSSPKGQLWEKTTGSDNGWALIVTSQSAGASSSTGSWRVSAFNVPVDGTTDAVATLNTLTGTTMPQTGGPFAMIVGPSEVVKLASDVTIPITAQVQSTGGVLKPASGKKVVLMAQPVGAGKMFDHSAGGVVLSGRALTANPRWWGADPTGVADSTAAFDAAYGFCAADPSPGGGAPTGTWGGRVHIDAGTYNMAGYGKMFGAGYANLLIEGDGPSTILKSPAGRVIGTAPEWEGLITVYGGAQFTTLKHTIRDLAFKGQGSSDATTFIIWDQGEELTLENLYFQDNGIESVRALSGTDVRKVNVHNCHAYNVGRGRGAAWMNIGAQSFTMTDCTVEASSIGVETANSFTTISNCRFKDMTNWGIMMYSTWSGFLDAGNSYAQYNAYAGTIDNCQFINIPDRAILIPDFTGHTNTDVVHTSPAHIDGNLGQIKITNNTFDRCGVPIWGGADKLGIVDCFNNQFSGQNDGGSGPQTPALVPQAGTWNIRNNTFQIGKGIQWTSLIGVNYITTGKTDRMSIVDNVVINKCWSTAAAFNTYQDTTIRGTRYLDLDGTIAAATTSKLVRIVDPADASRSICELKVSEWVWTDPNHQICMGSEPTILPVNGNTLPALISFKPGDVLVNRGSTAAVGWFNKKCVTGGTLNPTALSTCTATGTSGQSTVTLASADAVMTKYCWISFPAIPAITPKRILTSPATSNTVTIDTPLEANVTAGTAVSFATPTWITDRDANSLTIASQAAGDILYASSTTNFTRLGKGSDGQFLTLSSGVPAWSSSIARYDAGNTSTALTVTWTDVRQEQKITLTSATPTVTIAGIPSGGYLILDVFQDGTGGRAPTFAQSGMTSLVWVGGNTPPTITPTASVSDRLIFHNDGTRCVANVVWQNL